MNKSVSSTSGNLQPEPKMFHTHAVVDSARKYQSPRSPINNSVFRKFQGLNDSLDGRTAKKGKAKSSMGNFTLSRTSR